MRLRLSCLLAIITVTAVAVSPLAISAEGSGIITKVLCKLDGDRYIAEVLKGDGFRYTGKLVHHHNGDAVVFSGRVSLAIGDSPNGETVLKFVSLDASSHDLPAYVPDFALNVIAGTRGELYSKNLRLPKPPMSGTCQVTTVGEPF